MSTKQLTLSFAVAAILISACSSSGASQAEQPPDTDQESAGTTILTVDEHAGTVDEHAGHKSGVAQSGSSSNAEGLELVLDASQLDSSLTDLKFSIVAFEDKKVIAELADYEELHTKQMHVTLVKHDLSEYLHVHPVLSQGVWSLESLPLSDGFYRLVADFEIKDWAHVALGTDITVGKSPSMVMAQLSQEVRTSSSGPYSVSVAGGTSHGSDQVLSFTINKDGAPVSAVEPYLGSNGHLVSYNSSSLAYTHMHPNTGITGGTITFKAPPTEHGFSKYFLEVKLDGKVRLFTFVLENM